MYIVDDYLDGSITIYQEKSIWAVITLVKEWIQL